MRLTDWNAFDWLLLSILLISMGVAYRRGIVRTVFGLLGFFGGLKLASWYYVELGDWLIHIKLVSTSPTARILGFLLIVIAAATFFEVMGLLVQKLLHVAGLKFLDRALGVVFGFVRGCVIGLGVLMVTTNFAPQSWIVTTSVLTPYFFAVAHDVSFLVPQYLQELMAAGAFNLKQAPPSWLNQR